jgi:hypothetical protein
MTSGRAATAAPASNIPKDSSQMSKTYSPQPTTTWTSDAPRKPTETAPASTSSVSLVGYEILPTTRVVCGTCSAEPRVAGTRDGFQPAAVGLVVSVVSCWCGFVGRVDDVAARARAWRDGAHSAMCDVIEPWAHGTVVRATSCPSFFDFNIVRVEDEPEMSVDALVAFADRALAGLAHRRIDLISSMPANGDEPSSRRVAGTQRA